MALLAAARAGHGPVVETLLRHGADPEAQLQFSGFSIASCTFLP